MRELSAISLVLILPLAAACHAAKGPASVPAHRDDTPASASPGNQKTSPRPFPAKASAEISQTLFATLDRNLDPCQDFFQYACGSWLATTEIPPDESSWGRGFSEIQKKNEMILRSILEEAAKDPGADPGPAKLGRYYGACMDEAAIEEDGGAPLKTHLERIDAVRSMKDLMRLTGELHAINADVLFSMGVEADFKNPTLDIAFFEQGGLGLFDRDYYLKDDEQSIGLRTAYEAHVARMLALLGDPESDSRKHATQVLALETELAKISRPRVELRDPDKNYNKVDMGGLERLAPELPWSEYARAIGDPDLQQLSVGQPDFFKELAKLASSADPETLRSYLRWHLVHSTARLLSDPFVREDFAFYDAILNGQKEIRPRWKRCVASTDGALGELLGRYYVERAFPGNSKQAAVELIQFVEAAFQANLKKLPWMDEETRKRAMEKLRAVSNKIGYPDAWRDYSGLVVKQDDFFGNAIAARTFEFRREIAKIGKPVDRKEWGITPPTVNAYYNPLNNEMVFPAGIMQPPFFDHLYPAPMSFGGIGMVMGHELTHGFDDAGRKFDPNGRLQEWWAPEASRQFERQAKCVSDLYSTFEPQPGVHVNGELTLGENIADLGGVKEAYGAYKTWEEETGSVTPAVEGMTNDELFFVGFAQAWCSRITPEVERFYINLDSHSPDRFRVNGALANFPAFGAAFDCKAGTPMRPEKPCLVW